MSFDRDGLGQELARRFGDRTVVPNTYDPLGRRLTQSLIRDGYTRARRRYSYRSDGHLNGVEDLTGGHSGYEMDPTGRVTAVRGPQGRSNCQILWIIAENLKPAVAIDRGLRSPGR